MRNLLTVLVVVVVIWSLNMATGFLTVNYAAKKHKQAAALIEGIARASEVKHRINQFFAVNGRLPDSNQELGIAAPEAYQSSILRSTSVGSEGQIRIDYAGEGLEGTSVMMRPVANLSGTGPSLRWECFAVNVDQTVTDAIHEPHCTPIRDVDAVPPLPATEVTLDNLINAIHGHNASLVRYLIVAGVNVNGQSRTGESPLAAAISVNDAGSLELLLEAGANEKQTVAPGGLTPLMLAARSRCNANSIRLLVGAGAELEARDGQGMTALMHAAQSGENNCVTALLRAGARSDAIDNNGNRAINYAANYGQSSSVYATLQRHEIKQRQGEDFFYRLPPSD